MAALMLEDRILYIDAEAIVLDKPAGLPVDAPRRGGESIASRLDELRCGFKRMPTPMHRLDQDTSGCLLFARSPKARALLQQAFEAHQVQKYYLAVVASEVAEEQGTVDLPLSKTSSAEAGWRMVGDPKGQSAITHWRRLAVRDGRTLVEFRPVTGRTHQIRVHAREAFGSGIVGDRVYGVPGGEMLLRASRLIVPRSGKPAIDVTAPLPEHFGEWRDAA
jgi:tRNA pseudouridine32 synthase/23S rRNA pseudouridine746 synthase